ncbi:MAG: sulfatase-like hydrolase/transferase [Verrucomicrobiales bacterium]|nr:sulfatase-like hydrolase/transferase [Verrucomicrobiales bacterium]
MKKFYPLSGLYPVRSVTVPCTIAIFCLLSSFLKAADKPNVLLILVDDLKPALGCYGDTLAKTPNIDQLAARGTKFDLAYCNQAVCAPSRFTLMLGSHSTSTGLYGLGSNLRESFPDAVTLPQHFAKHGYRTESLGKIFHIGHGNLGDPESFSIPHFKEKVIEYVDPASKPEGKLTREEAMFQNVPAPPEGMNSLPRGAAFESPDVADDAYADGRVADETIRRLTAAKERVVPFFIAAGFARPHLPFSAPKKYWDLYQPDDFTPASNPDLPAGSPKVAHKRGGEIRNYFPVPDKKDPAQIDDKTALRLIHGYYASTSFVDAQIGKVLKCLKQLDLAENTIVVLWGDHGFHLGDLGIWTKHTNYEQANRIPIIFAGPGIGTNRTTEQPAESVDIYPTLAELAGLPQPTGPQPIDGLSLVPVLKDPDARIRGHTFHAYPKKKIGRAIRTARYRLVEWKKPGAPPKTAELELYDYETDPLETKNLASEKPEVVEELRSILATYPEAVAKDNTPEAPETTSPKIAKKRIDIVAEVNIRPKVGGIAKGVVMAQGGSLHGYAIHFVNGKPAFDVRVKGEVTRVICEDTPVGPTRIEASLGPKKMTLAVKGFDPVSAPSPGLIPSQPKDGLSVGYDDLSAAGNYSSPNPFNHTIVGSRVDVGGKTSPVPPPTSRDEIKAALHSHNRAFHITNGWIRDPYIVTAPDGTHYLTGTTPLPGEPREKSDPYNTGLGETSLVGWKARVWQSKDMIDWNPAGTNGAPFSLLDGIWPKVNADAHSGDDRSQWRLWAPELHWIDHLGKWALTHTSPGPVQGANLSLSSGPEPVGPWTNPFGKELGRKHDPSLFKDDDGTWYLVWGATEIAPLKPDFSGFAKEPVRIGPGGETAKMGHEGCLIMKIEGKYVLFGTGWSTGKMRRGSYNLYYATAERIEGPYSSRKFAGRFLGHGTPFTDDQGRWWCTAFYNANVPPLTRKDIETRDLSMTAQTINRRGVTLVPLEVRLEENGELYIRAKDPAYGTVGPDEAQKF